MPDFFSYIEKKKKKKENYITTIEENLKIAQEGCLSNRILGVSAGIQSG